MALSFAEVAVVVVVVVIALVMIAVVLCASPRRYLAGTSDVLSDDSPNNSPNKQSFGSKIEHMFQKTPKNIESSADVDASADADAAVTTATTSADAAVTTATTSADVVAVTEGATFGAEALEVAEIAGTAALFV